MARRISTGNRWTNIVRGIFSFFYRQRPTVPIALFIFFTASMTIVSGCDMNNNNSDGISVTVQFNQPYTIKEGTTVELNGLNVGQVSDSNNGDAGTRVTLALDSDKAGVVQKNSSVAYNGMQDKVIVYNSVNASESVGSGDQLQSLNSPLEEIAWQAGRAIGLAQEGVRNAASSFNSYFQSEEWQRTRERVEDDMRAFAEQSRQAANSVSEDIESFMKDLESESRGAVDQAREQLKSLEEELRGMSETGQQDASERMERLLQSLRQALEGRSGKL